jgi:hypothetical protein
MNTAEQFKATYQEIERASDELVNGFSLTFDGRTLTASAMRKDLESDPTKIRRMTDFIFHSDAKLAETYYFNELAKIARTKVREAFDDYETYPIEWRD